MRVRCATPTGGWNTTADSGSNVWTRWNSTWRGSTKRRREEARMENSSEGVYRAVARRRMPAPREVVFEAWIDLEGIREWMCPGDATSAEARLDVRVGGNYRIVVKGREGDHVHTGVYQVVEPNSKLVFTWAEEGRAGTTLVTVEFFAR